jgi:general secretion pathway protein E
MNKEQKPMIMCVDDDEVTLRLLERVVRNAGWDVIAAGNGRNAIEKAKKARPDVILLDIMMPEMNGYQVCARLQKDKKTSYIPIIFVTALGEEQDKARAFSVGGADYLVKPVKKDTLLNKIRLHLKTDTRWKEIKEETVTWYENIQPSNFVQFREFLFGKLNLDAKTKYRLSTTTPSRIYLISSDIGVDEDLIARNIAEFLKLPHVSHINPDDIKLGVLPTPYCQSNYIIPINDESGKTAFVLSNPFDMDLIDNLMKFSGLDKEVSDLEIAAPGSIDALFDAGKLARAAKVTGISTIRERPKAPVPAVEKTAKLTKAEIREKPVVHIANTILDMAVAQRASDIHIEPKEFGTVIRFRIDGDMTDVLTVKKNTGIKIISRYKAIGDLDLAEKRKPQDGAFAAEIDEKTFNFRVSTTSTPDGESLVMRMLESYSRPKDLSELGMTERQVEILMAGANRKAGLILIVGGTGSGKTTTIYSLLSKIDCATRSLMSVEDPVEYRIPLANQQQVNEKRGVTFEAILKASVRQDPDILYMGEVRDEYSAKMAVNFASTGHLTVTTLHTSNATTAIFRLERLGITRGIMADTILAVVAQRLLKKLCRHCRETSHITKEEIDMLSPFTDNIPDMVAHPAGCAKCNNTGYYGREGVYEVLQFDPDIAEKIRTCESIAEIRAFCKHRGDYLIADHAIEKMRNLVFAPEDIYKTVFAEEIDYAKPAQAAAKRKTVPMEPPAPPEKPVAAKAAPGAVTEESAPILLVDDDEVTRRLITNILEKNGYSVTTASDGIEALLHLGSKKKFGLVLSDVNMPNLNGFKLLEMIDQKGIGTPVIFITSRIDPKDEERGFKLGAMDYIRKPINKEVLLLRVKRLLGEE